MDELRAARPHWGPFAPAHAALCRGAASGFWASHCSCSQIAFLTGQASGVLGWHTGCHHQWSRGWRGLFSSTRSNRASQWLLTPTPLAETFLDMILPQLVPVKSPCRTSARRFSSSYLMQERSRNSYYAADLECKVCHLHWSRAGLARVFIDWNQQPVLLLATRLLANRDAKSFQFEKGAAYDRQQIQMGLRKGNTVLIHYRRGSDLYQSVLVMQDADLKPSKVSPEQHKYWRYVAPARSYFDWLPEKIATTFCSTALEAFPGRRYGEVEHLEEMDNPRYPSMCFQNIYHIGDTKSGQELEVFLTMPLERLRLGCGIQCTETMLPLGPNQRPRLYAAALKLLRFALRLEKARYCSEAEEALGIAMRPLLQLQDEHVLATLSAVVLALKEGRTGLPIGGVFGAGKTRSAAVLLAGAGSTLRLQFVARKSSPNLASPLWASIVVRLQLLTISPLAGPVTKSHVYRLQ